MTSKALKNEIEVEKMPGVSTYNVSLSCGVQLHFICAFIGDSKNSLSHILYNFDLDICQVAFIGDKIISTFPFLEALATKSFIVYSLHAEVARHICTRIEKYCKKGFHLLEPIGFDGDFNVLMAQEEIPIYYVEQQQYIDDDGEIQIATKEYHRIPARSVDTFRLQEKFIHMVRPELLQYK
ncbi:unnamed protein product [Rotaria socialis]|uniref:Uncharacterized protein n=2 Tax=Rotaria socialis TaxID=392032 RepID=A0A818B936_9BILA|nr:unnamed protein product [Rotaria socialis]CAF3164019.1 unnamed protein product [Rotaria socialis]CAF3417022.1 unnamed protein product [Rotaria socialis]CAF4251271.1 unnamed protein product [Rotaria socialis]CAF4727850.1 unnamed protein product [Rotaria socialis]